jgi:hypothetical protein
MKNSPRTLGVDMFMFNEIFGRTSLKDYCPIIIFKEEAD